MNEDQIIAYVDGELGPLDALRFERAMEADPSLAAEVGRQRALRDRIAGHFQPLAEAPPPAHLTALLDRSSNVAPLPAKRRRFGMEDAAIRYAAIAATLVIGLVVGQALPRGPVAPLGERDGAIVAQGELARALDMQLASAPREGPYRVGVSFVARDGRFCRTFSGADGAGIGCRGVDGWSLERFVGDRRPDAATVYRQAASPSAEILAAAQDMMAGDPLDGAGERQARDRGWRQP